MNIIYCDAAPNTVKKQIGSHGKMVKFDNGGYRIGVYDETAAQAIIHYNTRCPDQFAGECFSVLRAIEYAKDAGLDSITVRNDRIGGFDAVSKKKARQGYIGGQYLWIASKIAKESNIEVTFEWVSSGENKADCYSRDQARPGNTLFDTNPGVAA